MMLRKTVFSYENPCSSTTQLHAAMYILKTQVFTCVLLGVYLDFLQLHNYTRKFYCQRYNVK